jgi:uncharacterized Zn finger protein
MTATKTEFNPYSIVLEITSDPNFFYAKSSNDYDYYGVLLTGEGAAICSCPAGSRGVPCKHRKAALARFPYMTEAEEEWDYILAQVERQAELEAVRDLFGIEAA